MENIERELREIKQRLAYVESQKAEVSQLEELRTAVDQRLKTASIPGRTAWEAPLPVKVQTEVDNAEKDPEEGKMKVVPDEADVEDDPREYELEESTWDAVLVCGLMTKRGETLMIVLGCVLNLFIQILYCIIVAKTLAQPTINESKLKHLAIWRMVIGHKADHYDALTSTSLVSRTCADSGFAITSAAQQGLFTQLEKYKLPNDVNMLWSPPALCIISMFFWIMIALGDLVRTFDLARALASLPRSRCSRLREEDGKTNFETIGRWRLLCLIFGVVVPKIGISVAMGILGVTYLIYTKSAADLLLNAIALQFVLDTDELLFSKLVPVRVRGVLSDVQAIPINDRLRMPLRCRRKFPFRAAALFLLTVLALCVVVPTLLAREIRLTDEGLRLLCQGNKDFFYATDRATGAITVSDTGVTKLSDTDMEAIYQSYPFRAVLQKTGLEPKETLKNIDVDKLEDEDDENRLYKIEEKPTKVEELNRLTALQAGDLLVCEDLVYPENKIYYSAFNDVGPRGDCEGLNATDCDEDLRHFCPVSCGCSALTNGLFSRVGCSSKCDQIATSVFQNTAGGYRRGERNGDGACADEPDYEAELGWYFRQVEELLLEEEMLVVNESLGGIIQLSEWMHEEIAWKTQLEMYVVRDVNINLGQWAVGSYKVASDAYEPEKCGIVPFVYKIFGLDLCDMKGSSLFQGRVTSIKAICIKTCGHCTEPQSTPYKLTSWSALVEWSNYTIPGAPLREINWDTNEVCTIYGPLVDWMPC